MRSKVVLNEHGFSIESHAKVFRKGKWHSRYVICRRVRDLGAPVLQVYKPAIGFRKKGTQKYALVLQNFVGIEKGFELCKRSLTLAVLMKDESVVLAFTRPQQLSLWELWFRESLGPSSVFFMQVKEAPKGTLIRQHICREVRVHVTENEFAVAAEAVPKVIAFFLLSEVQNISCMDNTFFFSKVDANQSREMYALISGQIERFYGLLLKSKEDNNLRFCLARQNTEGSWMVENPRTTSKQSRRTAPNKEINASYRLSFSQKLAKQFNQPVSELLRVTRRISGNFRANLSRATSNVEEPFYSNVRPPMPDEDEDSSVSEIFEHDYVNNVISVNTKGNNARFSATKSAPCPAYVNVKDVKTKVSCDPESSYKNISPSKSCDIPDYVNNAVIGSRTNHRERNSEASVQPWNMQQTSAGSVQNYQNWDNAGSVSLKTPALRFNDDTSNASSLYVMNEKTTPLMENLASISVCIDRDEEPAEIPGLCRPPTGGVLLGRSPPARASRSNLLNSVAGSFTRYDGERATHAYPRQHLSTSPAETAPISPADQVPPDVFENAVMKGRERLKQSDRRNSSFSNCTRISSVPARASFRLPNSAKSTDRPSGSLSAELRAASPSSDLTNRSSPTSGEKLVVEATIEINKEECTEEQSQKSAVNTPPPLPPRRKMGGSSRGSSLEGELRCSDQSLTEINYCDLSHTNERAASDSFRATSRERLPSYVEVDEASTLATKLALQQHRHEREAFASLNGTRNKSNSLSTITDPIKSNEQPPGTSSPSTVSLFLQKCREPWKKPSAASISQSNLTID